MKIIMVLSFSFIISVSIGCNSMRTENVSTTSNISTNLQESKQDGELSNSTKITENTIKRKETIQNQLLKGENLHDGAIGLQHIGDINSVPALLVVLKKHPPDRNGTMVCTTAHAVEALQTITKAKVGYKFDDWNNWWTKYQKNHKVESK